ncbi:MAG: hypothetical protein CMD65_04890 [Gammaproteobacteria bacterium]|nr:hypothetical protein [Gammaproteobacteria bacterium]|tara:strand:+ start:4624 stop:5076 length:453 start_codon:yes stop_codon:yes gene_type:complete
MKFLDSLLSKIVSTSNKNITTEIKNSFNDHIELATCILMIEVARSDENFDDIEKEKILSIAKNNFNLNDDQTRLLIHLADKKNQEMISLYEWTSKINESCEYSEKKRVIEFLWDVAFADNIIDKYEDHSIRKIADLLYIKHQDFIKAKLK